MEKIILLAFFSLFTSTTKAYSLTKQIEASEIVYNEHQFRRSLDISRSCQEELSVLRNLEEFKVRFPTLTEQEYKDHCTIAFNAITCDLNGTSLVNTYQKICEDDAGGKMVQMNMTASGACVDFIDVKFLEYPLCAGKSCDAAAFIESYEAKLKSEYEITGEDCTIDLTSSASSISYHLIVTGILTTVAFMASLCL